MIPKRVKLLHQGITLVLCMFILSWVILPYFYPEGEIRSEIYKNKEQKLTKKYDQKQKIILFNTPNVYSPHQCTNFSQITKRTIEPDFCNLLGLFYRGRIPWLGIFNRFI